MPPYPLLSQGKNTVFCDENTVKDQDCHGKSKPVIHTCAYGVIGAPPLIDPTHM
jgi:hypothetical protein